MKTRVLSLMLFALLFAAFVCPAAASDSLSAENEVYAEAYGLLDPQSKALLSRLGVEGGDLTSLLTFSPASLAELVRDAFAAAGQESRETFLSAGLILLLTGILLPLCPERLRETTGQCAVLLAVFCIAAAALSAAKSAAAAVTVTRTLELSLLPVPVAAAALGGKPLTAAVAENGLFLFSETVGAVFSDALTPLTGILLVLCTAAAVSPDAALGRLAAGLTKGLTILAGLAAGLFALVIRLQGAVSGPADGLSVKTARILVGSAVPVVGGALSDTLSGVLGSLRLAGGSVAVLGILLALVTLLPALASIVTVKLFLWAVSLAAPALDLQKAGDFAGALSPAFTLFGAVAVFHAAVYVLTLGMLLH